MARRKSTIGQKQPLYRKVNTTARHVHHKYGGEARWDRNTKATRRATADEVKHAPMKSGKRRGLDYTPLFNFLLKQVGRDWDEVYGEAVARLDRPDPIFYMVDIRGAETFPYFRGGETANFSQLYVTPDNKLAVLDPNFTIEMIVPSCTCCTHTFNGKPISRRDTK